MTREELERDEQNLIAQIQQASGALTYVRLKLKELAERESKKTDRKPTKETPKEA